MLQFWNNYMFILQMKKFYYLKRDDEKYNQYKLKLRSSISNLVDEVPLLYKQNSQLLKSIWNRIRSLRYISMPHFFMRPETENYEITYERKFLTREIPTRKNFGPTKYPQEKSWTREIPTKKNFGPTKYPREKNLDPTKYP